MNEIKFALTNIAFSGFCSIRRYKKHSNNQFAVKRYFFGDETLIIDK